MKTPHKAPSKHNHRSFQWTLTVLIWAAALIPALLITTSQLREGYEDRFEFRKHQLIFNARNAAMESRKQLADAIDQLDKFATDGNVIKSSELDILSVRAADKMEEFLSQQPAFEAIMMVDSDYFQTEIAPDSALTLNMAPFHHTFEHLLTDGDAIRDPKPHFTVVPAKDVFANERDLNRWVLGVSRPIIRAKDSVTEPFEVASVLFVIAYMDQMIAQSLNDIGLDLTQTFLEVKFKEQLVFSNFPDTPSDRFFTYTEYLDFGRHNETFELTVGLVNDTSIAIIELLDQQKNQLMITGGVLLLIFAFAYYLTRWLVKPIKQLRDLTETISKQNFAKAETLPLENQETFEEFAEVYDVLGQMSKTIREQFSDLTTYNQELKQASRSLEASAASSNEQNEILNALTQYALVIQNENDVHQIGELTLDIFSRITGGAIGISIYRNQHMKGFQSLDEAPMPFLIQLNSHNKAFLTEADLNRLNETQTEFTAIPIYVKDQFNGFVVIDRENQSHFQVHAVNMFITVLQSTLEQRVLTLQLEKLANSDALTDLYNRHFFDTELKRMTAKYKTIPNTYQFAVIVVDINGLKIVNDRIGHSAGDQLIQSVARILGDTIRQSDTLARTGGDEFVILMEDTDSHFCDILSARLKAISGKQVIQVENQEVKVTFSVGYASSDTDDATRLFEIADARMYKEKEIYYVLSAKT